MEVDKGGSTGDTRSSDLTDGMEVEKGKVGSTGTSHLIRCVEVDKEKGGCSNYTTEPQDLS